MDETSIAILTEKKELIGCPSHNEARLLFYMMDHGLAVTLVTTKEVSSTRQFRWWRTNREYLSMTTQC